ncbi:hypothetical protein BH23GEM3_BH23GEM3_13980 [soil metagenome]
MRNLEFWNMHVTLLLVTTFIPFILILFCYITGTHSPYDGAYYTTQQAALGTDITSSERTHKIREPSAFLVLFFLILLLLHHSDI